MIDLKKTLSPQDTNALGAQAGVTWVPKDPREMLLPYMSDVPDDGEQTEDKIRAKAKEVIDGYNTIIKDCERLEATISERSKDVKVPLTREKDLRVIEALARIFGLGEVEEITFQMYQVCIRELSLLTNNTGAPKL